MDPRWNNTGNSRPYWQVAVSLLFSLLATVTFLLISWKLLIFFMPFVIGWIFALIVHPLVAWVEKRLKIVRKLASAIIIILVLGLLVLAIYFATSKIAEEVTSLIHNFPELYQDLEKGLRQIGDSMSGVFAKLPGGVQAGWQSIMDNLDKTAASFMSKISEPTVMAAGNFAKSLPSYLLAVVFALMSAYFFVEEKDQVVYWVKRVAPPSVEKRMDLVFRSLRQAVGGYFKAQFKIMIIVFAILFVAFSIMGVHYSILLAILIAFLDFLPFFGTGTAMIPWAIYKLLVGNYKMAILLLIIYGITQAAHQFLQPKLIGDSIGMNPLVTLFCLYAGYKLGSVFGMILAVPVGMVVINLVQAGAFDYILDDVSILVEGILGLRDTEK
ncbi:MAG: sporulation integral membrane protein YtvI [Hespellia sp.]|nr:sporulation integral membrane protein YtvI [Hespellia sp.]